MLPLSEERHRRSRIVRLLSSPMGTYGGWICSNPLGPQHRALLTDYLANRLGDVVWRINPFDPGGPTDELGPHTDDVTHAIALADGFSSVVSRWSKGHRSAARKARREGVTATIARTGQDWRAFSEVYAATVRRWGEAATSSYGSSLFEILARRNSPNVKLWIAVYEGAVVAGALCLYARHHAVYWLGGALASHFHLRPVHLLVHDAVEDACDRGYDWFDLNPSGGHRGVVAFKRGFGPVELEAPVVTRESLTARTVASLGHLIRRRSRA